MKLDEMISDFKDRKVFGSPAAIVYTVEWQKRGLPHAHILLFLNPQDQAKIAEDVDKFISAEIPDKEAEPELYEAVRGFMLHGPYGPSNLKSPCMQNNRCSKQFPKPFNERTIVDENGYNVYRRRDIGETIEKGECNLHNEYVVPFNAYILLKYRAHINVEYCNQSMAIKYLFNYINKGSDRMTLGLQEDDEVERFIDCRYVSACEAIWRIYGFDLHYRTPPVEQLAFHMKGDQTIHFHEGDYIEDVLEKAETVKKFQFVKWMEYNRDNEDGRHLKYCEFPRYFCG